MANIKGGVKNDILAGTASADRMQGLGGNDRLTALAETTCWKAARATTSWSADWDRTRLTAERRGVADAQAALLSNGEAIIFDGYPAPPASLAGAGLELHADSFAIPELGTRSMTGG
jgi:Ca2+-binding RTX toxin-like protein